MDLLNNFQGRNLVGFWESSEYCVRWGLESWYWTSQNQNPHYSSIDFASSVEAVQAFHLDLALFAVLWSVSSLESYHVV